MITSCILIHFVSSRIIDDVLMHDVSENIQKQFHLRKEKHYSCSSFKTMHREVSLWQFQRLRRLRRQIGRTHKDYATTIFPVLVKSFSSLGLTVLPNKEICIGRIKLDGVLLPRDPSAQFKIMIGIAIWFSPCIQPSSSIKRRNCIERQKKRFYNLEFIPLFISIQELVTKFRNPN